MPHSFIAQQPAPPSTDLCKSDAANKHYQHFAPLPRRQRRCRLGGRFASALPPLRWHALRQHVKRITSGGVAPVVPFPAPSCFASPVGGKVRKEHCPPGWRREEEAHSGPRSEKSTWRRRAHALAQQLTAAAAAGGQQRTAAAAASDKTKQRGSWGRTPTWSSVPCTTSNCAPGSCCSSDSMPAQPWAARRRGSRVELLQAGRVAECACCSLATLSAAASWLVRAAHQCHWCLSCTASHSQPCKRSQQIAYAPDSACCTSRTLRGAYPANA